MKYRKAPLCLIFGHGKATTFNGTISMDLHELQSNIWYMHIIDEFSRYSNAVIIRSKAAVVKAFLKQGELFGVQRKTFSDNGGEFISEELYNMCDAFRIKIDVIPSCSPWNIGLCKRHNKTLTNMFLKIREDVNCDMDIALAWAVSMKNPLINDNGFSSTQLAFRKNCNFRSAVNNNLPT